MSSKIRSSGLPVSPRELRAKPKITAKKMTCSMLPLARASMGFIGTMLSRVWIRLGGVICFASRPFVERSSPMPGCMMLARNKPMATATPVVRK